MGKCEKDDGLSSSIWMFAFLRASTEVSIKSVAKVGPLKSLGFKVGRAEILVVVPQLTESREGWEEEEDWVGSRVGNLRECTLVALKVSVRIAAVSETEVEASEEMDSG